MIMRTVSSIVMRVVFGWTLLFGLSCLAHGQSWDSRGPDCSGYDFGSPAVVNCAAWAYSGGVFFGASAGAYAIQGSTSALAVVGEFSVGATSTANFYGYYCTYAESIDGYGSSASNFGGSLCEYGFLWAHG
jgi:hypothetical protein